MSATVSIEEQFLRLADLLPEALLLVSASGTILAANSGAASRLGRTPSSLPGTALARLTQEPADAVHQYLRCCARSRGLVLGALAFAPPEGGNPLSCRCEGAVFRPRSDEEEAVVLLRLTPREAAVGQFVELNQRIEALSREVARRQVVEEELRRQREWLRVTLASIGDAVIATDSSARVVFMNPMAETLTGWRQESALLQPLDQVFRIIHEESRQALDNPVVRVLREGEIVGLDNHTLLINRDGAERAIADCAAPIRDDREQIIGAVMVFHDVTESRRLASELIHRAEELARRDQQKDEFLAMLAHELRNPLVPIRNGLQVARQPDADPTLREQALDRAERQARHLTQVVNDLLDATLLLRGQVPLRSDRLDLVRLIRNAVEDHRDVFQQADVELTIEAPATPIWVQGDSTRLLQVAGNLLDNARKFTGRGGRVSVEVREVTGEHQAIFSVRDTGVGIAADLLPHLFTVFTQAVQGIARSHGGLGLGLAVVKGLVELQGGKVRVASPGPGHGAEFTVQLPLEPEPPVLVEAGRQPRATQGPTRILIIEDNRDAADSLELLLRVLGHEVRVAYTGPDGVELAGNWLPEVVLSDIGLPGLDGYGVARALRLNPATARVRLIAVTGYGSETDRRLALEAGFDHHLTKPVDHEVLLSLIGLPGAEEAQREDGLL